MKYSIEFPKIQFNHDILSKLELPKFMQQELLTTRTRLIADTQSGKTASGGALKAYSSAYAEWKREKTGSSTVNLTLSGELMRAIVLAAIPGGYSLKFEGQHAPSKRGSSRSASTSTGKAKKSNTGNARSASGAKSAVAATRAKSTRGANRSASASPGGRKSSGGASSVSNAAIAEYQYSLGRGGWFSYSDKDNERIVNRFNTLLDKVVKNLVDIK